MIEGVNCLNLFSLNVRGLRNKQKRNMLFQFLVRQKSNVILLQETFLTEEIQKKLMKNGEVKLFTRLERSIAGVL